MRLFTIEGNIGAGKSTLLQKLREIKTVGSRPLVFVPEPVDSWQEVVDADGKHILELFYTDQCKYAFAFQMLAFISRYSLLEEAVKANPTAVIVTERCLFTDYFVFASMLHETGCMSEVEFAIYKKWFDRFNTTPLSGIVYLKCRPEKALARCKSRNRPGESVDLAYLTLCDEKHEWIDADDAPLLTLDANEEMSADLMEDWVDAVCLFIEEETHVPPYFGSLMYCSWTISLLLLPFLFYGQAWFNEGVA
jgi:deoxyadenosine/deoxycytidine kinase